MLKTFGLLILAGWNVFLTVLAAPTYDNGIATRTKPSSKLELFCDWPPELNMCSQPPYNWTCFGKLNIDLYDDRCSSCICADPEWWPPTPRPSDTVSSANVVKLAQNFDDGSEAQGRKIDLRDEDTTTDDPTHSPNVVYYNYVHARKVPIDPPPIFIEYVQGRDDGDPRYVNARDDVNLNHVNARDADDAKYLNKRNNHFNNPIDVLDVRGENGDPPVPDPDPNWVNARDSLIPNHVNVRDDYAHDSIDVLDIRGENGDPPADPDPHWVNARDGVHPDHVNARHNDNAKYLNDRDDHPYNSIDVLDVRGENGDPPAPDPDPHWVNARDRVDFVAR